MESNILIVAVKLSKIQEISKITKKFIENNGRGPGCCTNGEFTADCKPLKTTTRGYRYKKPAQIFWL